jgi:predicted small lipoprotein YifL
VSAVALLAALAFALSACNQRPAVELPQCDDTAHKIAAKGMCR